MPSTGLLHALSRLVVVITVLVACSMGVGLAPTAVHTAADLSNVGALTPFTTDNALDLEDYCNGADQGDDTVCIGTWR